MGGRIAWRDLALFVAGVIAAPLLLTLLHFLLYRVAPIAQIAWPLWVPDLVMLVLIAVVAFVMRWKPVAIGMLVSGLLWHVFIIWLTAQVSPDW